jgi:hypothetical protein
MPDIVQELRKEINTVLYAHGGVVTTGALFEMKLLDSVLRESQRMNAPGQCQFCTPSMNLCVNLELANDIPVAFRRKILKTITLKDGTVLPAGTTTETANVPVLRDRALYPDPDRFDPYRFLTLRTDKSKEDPIGYANREQYQFVSVNQENMNFGFGRHACPGRFFAAQEIKMILLQVLLRYDMKMPDGLTSRYENVVMGPVRMAARDKDILIKRAF